MKPLILVLLGILAVFTWWRSRSRLMRTVRAIVIAYLAITAYRVVTWTEDDQLVPLAGFLALFAAIWGLSWLVTRAVLANRRP
jgi:hypothetical protein